MSTRKDQLLRIMSGKKGRAVALTREEKALRDVAEKLEEMGGGGASIDVVAEVGQTIVVEEVDGFGKPTKWKAADYQEKICGIEEEVIYEGVVEINSEVETLPNVVSAPMAGETCKISWNGAEYSCVAFEMLTDMGVTIFVGNSASVGMDDTGEPFTIGFAQGTAIVMPLDGSTRVSLVIAKSAITKIPTKFVPTLEEMRGEETVLLPETTLTADENGELGFEATINFAIGETYDITWNGVSYPCEAVDGKTIAPGAPSGAIALGNIAMAMGTGDTGEPFAIIYLGGSGFGSIIPFDESTSGTLSIKGNKIMQIPKKFLPDMSEAFYFDVEHGGLDGQSTFYGACKVSSSAIYEAYISGKSLYAVIRDGESTTYASINKVAGLILPLVGVQDMDDGAGILFTFSATTITHRLVRVGVYHIPGGQYDGLTQIYYSGSMPFVKFGNAGCVLVVKETDGYGAPISWEQVGLTSTIQSEITTALSDGVVINSSTEGSTKKFKLTVDDSGTITATEVV